MTVCKGSNCVIPIYLQLLNLNTFRFPIFSHAKKRWSVLCVNCGCHKNWYLYSLSARSSALAQIIWTYVLLFTNVFVCRPQKNWSKWQPDKHCNCGETFNVHYMNFKCMDELWPNVICKRDTKKVLSNSFQVLMEFFHQLNYKTRALIMEKMHFDFFHELWMFKFHQQTNKQTNKNIRKNPWTNCDESQFRKL